MGIPGVALLSGPLDPFPRTSPRLVGLSSTLPLSTGPGCDRMLGPVGLPSPLRLLGRWSTFPLNTGPGPADTRGCRAALSASKVSFIVCFSCAVTSNLAISLRLPTSTSCSFASFSSTDAMMVSTISSASSPNTELLSVSSLGVGGSCISPRGDLGVDGAEAGLLI